MDIINEYRDEILKQWTEKLKKIFKYYLPFEEINDTAAMEECKTVWKWHIIDTGWKPKILKDLTINNENIEKEIIIDAFNKLGLPKEIIE